MQGARSCSPGSQARERLPSLWAWRRCVCVVRRRLHAVLVVVGAAGVLVTTFDLIFFFFEFREDGEAPQLLWSPWRRVFRLCFRPSALSSRPPVLSTFFSLETPKGAGTRHSVYNNRGVGNFFVGDVEDGGFDSSVPPQHRRQDNGGNGDHRGRGRGDSGATPLCVIVVVVVV